MSTPQTEVLSDREVVLEMIEDGLCWRSNDSPACPNGPESPHRMQAEAMLDAARTESDARIAELQGFLALRPSGNVGPLNDRIPWFTHCGISHAEGAECVVCAALSSSTGEPT